MISRASRGLDGSTNYNAGVISSLTIVPVCNTSLSDELIDERIDDHSRNRFRKLYQENDEYLEFW